MTKEDQSEILKFFITKIIEVNMKTILSLILKNGYEKSF